MFTVSVGARGAISTSVVDSVLAVAQAAANYWDRFIDTSLASIDIEVNFVSLGGTTLAQAGTDYYYAFSSGGFDFFEPETLIEAATGFDENGSNPDIPIDIDTNTLNAGHFNLGPLVDGVSAGGAGYDLWSIFVHEIAHGLGLLTFLDGPGSDRTTFDRYVVAVGAGYSFNGPDSNFGPIALDSSIAHVASSIQSVLNPTVASGYASYLTALDVSIFGDIGASLKRPTAGDDLLGSFGTRSTSSGANPALHALAGNDTILGLPTADQLFGDEGNDFLSASAGVDYLYGGDGDDDLRGGGGPDVLDGGPGIDFADYSSAGAVRVDLSAIGAGSEAAGDSYNSIEGAFGSAFADTLVGDSAANGFSGLAGNDSIEGGAGDDTIDAGAGSDSVSGGDAIDVMHGGGGDDLLDGGLGDDTLGGEAGRDRMLGDGGADTLHGFGGHDTLHGGDGNDDLRGGFGKDLLNGVADDDVVRGFEDDDRLFGGGGVDTLLGGDGADSLIGGGGGDRLKGDSGNDTLNGSFGADLVSGGLGDDVFEFRATHGADGIDDFTAGAASEDVVKLIAFGAAFDTFAEVLAAASDDGTDTTIDFGGGDMLVLEGVLVAALHADDFAFV